MEVSKNAQEFSWKQEIYYVDRYRRMGNFKLLSMFRIIIQIGNRMRRNVR